MRVIALPNAHYPPAPDALALADAVIASPDELTPGARPRLTQAFPPNRSTIVMRELITNTGTGQLVELCGRLPVVVAEEATQRCGRGCCELGQVRL